MKCSVSLKSSIAEINSIIDMFLKYYAEIEFTMS